MTSGGNGEEHGGMGGATDSDGSKKPVQSPFIKPSLRGPFQRPSGIQAIEINSARQMVQLHTRSRAPVRSGLNAAEQSMARNSMNSSGRTNITTSPPSTVRSSSGTSSNSTNIGAPDAERVDQSSSGAIAPNSTSSLFPGTFASVLVPATSHKGQCKNPQCDHCGQVIIPSPQASFPIQDKPSITIKDWSIYTIKQPILSSPELDKLGERYNFPLPEMIFGNNVVRIINDKTKETIEFAALDALDTLDDDCKLKVSYHEEWLESRRSKHVSEKEASEKDLKHLTEVDTLKPYDWTYSVNYKGTCSNLNFSKTDKELPIDKLLKPDPILFFDESVLFEDELADNGISMLSTKIRVMPTCLLLLCRFFLRIDNVIFRIRDVRVFVYFDTNEVLRDYKEQEYPYDELYNKITSNKALSDPKKLLRDANWVSQNIPIVHASIESNNSSDVESTGSSIAE